MSLGKLGKILNGIGGGAGVYGPPGNGGAGGGGFTSGYDYKLTAERLEEWEWMTRFIEMNPDLKERWEQHKTYEILKNEHVER